MKRLLSIAFLVLTLGLQAQEKDSIALAKKWLVGGNAKFYVETVGSQTARLIVDIEPQAGYFITNWFAVGLRLPVSFTSDAFRTTINPFVRFYLPVGGNIIPFAELNGGHAWRMIYDTQTSAYDDVERCWILGTQAGAAFFINQNVSIDVYLYYSGQNCQLESNGVIYPQRINHNFGLGAGFQIYF